MVGIGLQFYETQLISNNNRKQGYFCLILGLIILFANAVWKM